MQRLAPLGVSVRAAHGEALPVVDGSIDLVLDRHGRLAAHEVARVLAPGGVLLTQQVGSEDCTDLNDALGAARPRAEGSWTADVAQRALERAGLVVDLSAEEHPVMTFGDLGAVVVHLRAVPWQLPGTTVADHHDAFRRIYQRWTTDGPLVVRTHRFLLAARCPQPAVHTARGGSVVTSTRTRVLDRGATATSASQAHTAESGSYWSA